MNRWVSSKSLIGGGILALMIVGWGVSQWNMPLGYFAVISVPFVFVSAVFRDFRMYLFMVIAFIAGQLGIGMLTSGGYTDLTGNILQWFIIVVAGEIIFQVSHQRRNAEEINHRRIREMEAMNETLTRISGELDLNTLLQSITEHAVRLLHGSLGELLLYDSETGELEVVAQYPNYPKRVGLRVKPGEGSIGRVAVTKRPTILNDYKSFLNAQGGDVTTDVEATLDVPFFKGNEFVGVLGIARHEKNHEFTLDDQSLLTVFANQATVAITNARLYKEIEHLAFTDPLTGIFNRRRFFELAERECKRSLRYHRPLSMMLVDIDHFKRINDKHGHIVGDNVLKWFATECRRVIRHNIDVIGRFGGEEFAIIYPETALDAALYAAERVQKHFTPKRLPISEGELQITFSAGIASLTLHEKFDLDQLIERADKALSHAKDIRDCMAYWSEEKNSPQYVRAKNLLA